MVGLNRVSLTNVLVWALLSHCTEDNTESPRTKDHLSLDRLVPGTPWPQLAVVPHSAQVNSKAECCWGHQRVDGTKERLIKKSVVLQAPRTNVPWCEHSQADSRKL